jgi:hypothetical protein
MPKPVKKAQKRLPVPPKTKRPSDPNRAAHAQLAEHMARLESPQPPWAKGFGSAGIEVVTVTHSFEDQYKAHMAKLGAKGGKISGAKRMEMPERKRIAIAKKAAAARWAGRRRG